MAGSIKGIIVEIGGDTSGLQKAISKVNSATSSLTKELRGVNSLLKLDPKNTELLSQKQEILSEAIETTSEKLSQLKKIQEEANKDMSKVSPENYRNLQREIASTENKLKQLQLQASKWNEAGKKLEEFGNKFTNISSKIDNVGSKLTTSLTLPILAIGTAAVTTGNDFEKQMSRVQAISGATKDELEQLTNQAIDLGASTSFSASEVASGMENLASAGFTTSEIMEAMPGLLDLAASSGAELATASEIAASAIRGFGLEANESAHVADVFAEAAARTNAQTEDMGEAMKYVAPVAKTVGLSIEETAAAIGIMSDAGIKGSQAGTTLRSGLVRIVKPTKQVKDAMEQLNVEFYNSDGTMKSLTEIVEVLQKSTAGLTDETKNQALAQIFGTEALSGMLALVNRGSDELSNMTKSFEDADGAASEMADTMLNNTSGAIEELKGSLESAGIAIQKELAPYIKDLADYIKDLVDKFNDLSDEEKDNIIKTVSLTAAIGPALKIIGNLGSGIGKVVKISGKLSQKIGELIPKITQTSTGTFKLKSALSALGVGGAGAVAFFGAAALGIGAYQLKQHETIIEANKLTQETIKQKEAFNSLIESQNQKLAIDMQQISKTEELWQELQKITDENGKVKSGYEERAKVITSALSEALGTEINLNGDVVQGYKDIQNEIDNLIRKKKAEAIMSAQEEAYTEAFSARQDAYKKILDIQNQISEKQSKIAFADGRERAKLTSDIGALTKSLQEQQNLVKEYDVTIADYEYDQKLAMENTADSVAELINRNAISYQSDVNNLQQSGLDKLNYYTAQLQNYKNYKQQERDAGNTANEQMYQDQINADEQQLQLTAQSFAKQITKIEDLTPEMVKTYGDIADYSTDEFNKAISNLPENVAKELNSIIWTVDTSTLPNSTQSLGDRAAQKFKEKYNNAEGKSASDDYLAGAEKGLNSSAGSFWNLLFNIGNRGNSQFRKGLGDGSPSILAERAIIDYFAGANIGMNDAGKDLLKDMNKYGEKANSEFSEALQYSKINKKIKYGIDIPKNINGLQSALTSEVKKASNINYNINNIFNVQELDKERLEQCFNYINRKFGSKY